MFTFASDCPVNNGLKLAERRKNEWRCLLCCHVRTGTIFLGIWHLLLQLLGLSAIVVFFRNPDTLTYIPRSEIVRNDLMGITEQNIPINNVESTKFYNYDNEEPVQPPNVLSASNKNNQDDTDVFTSYVFATFKAQYGEFNFATVVLIILVTITATMLYGAIKGKPLLFLPFFTIQLLELCVTMMSALGFLFYLPDFYRMLDFAQSEYEPSLKCNPHYIVLVVILSMTISIITKTYYLAVVWSCYKYLNLKLTASRPTIHYIESNLAVQNLLRMDDNFADKKKKFPTPPPSYSVAVGEANVCPPDVPPPSYR
ncbi:lysosomal-associated transmembrane protein 4B [Adelges cooleyi]|uniref:lysosomal-associated transmembrane protein 4B n=1 Tax=Adelges cooleyi TaxID=133065 RepID=UPI0021800DCB|nr:lysosomal-associated transmembrane protein 4B [Adelges cooleyi]